MKRITGFLAGLFLAAAALAQVANSDQVLKKTDGGLQGDSSKNLAVAVKYSSTAPSSPLTGQPWCDTTTTPCTWKVYNGSSWVAPFPYSNASVQTDLTTFPSSPTDGQWFWDKSHHVGWIYDSTATLWYRMDGTSGSTTGSIVDNFTGSSITAPSSGMTIADGGASGNATVGTHVCTVTFATSTGGETTAGTSATSAVSITASHKITFSSVPTGGSGTTQRRFYCSKAGTSTPRFWVDTLNDNSTTTLTSSVLADGSMAINEPNRDYSVALSGSWTVTNTTAQTTSGGCGATGSSVICRISHSKTATHQTVAADTGIQIYRSISAYNTGDYTIRYRIVKCELGFGNTAYANGACNMGGLSTGSSWASGPLEMYATMPNLAAGPLSGTNVLAGHLLTRTTTGGTTAVVGVGSNPFIRISSFPFWVQIVKRGNYHVALISKDGVNFSRVNDPTSGANPVANPPDTTLGTVPTSVFDTFVYWLDNGLANANNDSVVELDSFSLTVN